MFNKKKIEEKVLFHTPIKDERTINYRNDVRSSLKSILIFYTFEHVLYKYIFFCVCSAMIICHDVREVATMAPTIYKIKNSNDRSTNSVPSNSSFKHHVFRFIPCLNHNDKHVYDQIVIDYFDFLVPSFAISRKSIFF